jgi:hypothetical protein
MGIRRGSISTPIIADGLIFNIDAANRASYVNGNTNTFNTTDLSQSGSLENDVAFTQSPTPSFEFDGVDDYVGLGNPTDLQITGAFSFSAWVKTTSNTYDAIYFKGNSIALSDIYIRMQNNGTIRFFINNVSKNVTSSTTVNDGNWHHIMCVYVPSISMTLYIDGAQDAQNTSAIPTAINNNYGNITLGSDRGSSQFWEGNISNFHIYNRTLSSTEVLHNYNALKGRFGL